MGDQQRVLILTESEATELKEREKVIDSCLDSIDGNWYEIAKQLKYIKINFLYKSKSESFDRYCRDTWSKRIVGVNRLIAGAEVIDNIIDSVNNTPTDPNGSVGVESTLTLPDKVSQTRPLASLPPDKQVAAWKQAVDTAPSGKVTAAHVKSVVDEIKDFHINLDSQKGYIPSEKNRQSQLDKDYDTCYSESDSGIEVVTQEDCGGNMDIHYSSVTSEWYTPKDIINDIITVLNGITLDPCSNKGEPNVPAGNHFTIDDDGLKREWFGSVYMNPPYGREIIDWVKKLIKEYESGNVTEAIALLPSRTDTEWFRLLYNYPLCFIDGRLKFIGGENSAPFPSVLVYLGNDINKFSDGLVNVGRIYVSFNRQRM